MKIRIALGLDLDALPLEEHWKTLERLQQNIASFYSHEHPTTFGSDMQVVGATGILTFDFMGRTPANLHVFGCFLPRFDIYRWTNVSKEL